MCVFDHQNWKGFDDDDDEDQNTNEQNKIKQLPGWCK